MKWHISLVFTLCNFRERVGSQRCTSFQHITLLWNEFCLYSALMLQLTSCYEPGICIHHSRVALANCGWRQSVQNDNFYIKLQHFFYIYDHFADTMSKATYNNSYKHSYNDGSGSHVSSHPAHQEQFGVLYLAQGHFSMQTRGIQPRPSDKKTPVLLRSHSRRPWVANLWHQGGMISQVH